jgi:ABC transporter related
MSDNSKGDKPAKRNVFGHSQSPAEKPRHFRQTVLRLADYLKDYTRQIVITIILTLGGVILTVIGPKVLGDMINQVTDDYSANKVYESVKRSLPRQTELPAGTTVKQLMERTPASERDKLTTRLAKLPDNQQRKIMALDITKKPNYRFDTMASTGLWLAAIYIIGAILSYLEGWVIAGVTQRVVYRLRREISRKINSLPLSYFDRHSYGDVLSRITNDIDTVSQNLSGVITQAFQSIVMVVGILAMMISINLMLTGAVMLTLPISAIVVGIVFRLSQKYFASQQEILGKLNGHIEETYSGHNIVKIFGGEKRAISKFNRYNNSLYRSSWRAQFIAGVVYPMMEFVGNLGFVIIVMLGGYLVVKGRLQIGDIQAFSQYIRRFNQPITQIANLTGLIQSIIAASERVFSFIDQPDEAITWQKGGQTISRVTGRISFDHVKFGYDSDRPVIHDLSVEIKPGQKVAIVGPTGAGKTTIVNLLMRFYDPDEGIIKLDGVDTRQISRHNIRRNFGMVLQDTWLFEGTIKENLLYGKPDVSEEELRVAVETAMVDHIIKSLPGGMDTILGESADNISAGERQLLTIARAMLANAPITILDEATSNVDTRTERLIQQAMDKLVEGRTSFVIAHRLSTIRNADLILVMDHGDIVESGTHDSLLEQNGFYAKLYNAQFAH